MGAGSSAATTTAERELVVTRIIDAPRDLVFRAWTEPEQVARWWGPQGFVTTHCDMDIRPGGAFRCCMRSPAGTDHWKRGVYREIVDPERIVFTFAWENADGNPGHELLTTVTFVEGKGYTPLVINSANSFYQYMEDWSFTFKGVQWDQLPSSTTGQDKW